MRVTYRYLRPMTVVYARGTGPYKLASEEAWARLNAWLAKHEARPRVKQAYGYLRDNPRRTATELLRYDACIPVAGDWEADPDAGIGRQTLSGGAYAVCTHVGPYSETGALFSQLHREVVPKRGLTLDYDRPFLMIFLNDPLLTRAMHRRTELCVPVLPVQMPLSSNDDDALPQPSVARAVG